MLRLAYFMSAIVAFLLAYVLLVYVWPLGGVPGNFLGGGGGATAGVVGLMLLRYTIDPSAAKRDDEDALA